MTPDERQALREKHQPMDVGDGGFYCNYCRKECEEEAWYGWGMVVEYPCDVIKVLDAYESLIEYHDHDGNTDREDPWCRTCWKPYPCEKGKALGHPDGAEV